MDKRSPLHWSALLLAVFALTWALMAFVGLVIFVIPPLGLAGFILVLMQARHLEGDARNVMRTGGWLGAGFYGLWILLRLVSLPVAGRIGGNEFSHVPPAFLGTLADDLGEALPGLGAAALVLSFWMVWDRRERTLGAVGVGLVLLVQLLTLLPLAYATAMGTAMQVGFALGFVLLAIATAMPLRGAEADHPVWHAGRDTGA